MKNHGELKDIITTSSTMISHIFASIQVQKDMKHAIHISELITMSGKLIGVVNGYITAAESLMKICSGIVMQDGINSIENTTNQKIWIENTGVTSTLRNVSHMKIAMIHVLLSGEATIGVIVGKWVNNAYGGSSVTTNITMPGTGRSLIATMKEWKWNTTMLVLRLSCQLLQQLLP